MKSNSLIQMTLIPLLMMSFCLLGVPEAFAENRAIIIGPNYPGGRPFDDTIAKERAEQMSQSLAQWANWDPANINTLFGDVNCAQIYAAISAAAAELQTGDIFLLIYHGHGSHLIDVENVLLGAANTCDETILPFAEGALRDHCTDDAINTALEAIPAVVPKFIILASCHSGGFWHGHDPPGDLENTVRICLLAGCGEDEGLPEPEGGSTFVNNLLDRLDRSGWPNQNIVTFQEFIDAVMDGAAGSAVNSNHWGIPLPKCPNEPNVFDKYDFDFHAKFYADGVFSHNGIFLRKTRGWTVQEHPYNNTGEPAHDLTKILLGHWEITDAIEREFKQHEVLYFGAYTLIHWFDGNIPDGSRAAACFNTFSGQGPSEITLLWTDANGNFIGDANVVISVDAARGPSGNLLVEVGNYWSEWNGLGYPPQEGDGLGGPRGPVTGTEVYYAITDVERSMEELNEDRIADPNITWVGLNNFGLGYGATTFYNLGQREPDDIVIFRVRVQPTGVGDSTLEMVQFRVGELSACTTTIPGDLNRDCYVDFRDFAVFTDNWLRCSHSTDPDCP